MTKAIVENKELDSVVRAAAAGIKPAPPSDADSAMHHDPETGELSVYVGGGPSIRGGYAIPTKPGSRIIYR